MAGVLSRTRRSAIPSSLEEKEVSASNIGRSVIVHWPANEETGKGAGGENGNDNADRVWLLIGCERRHGF